MAYAIKYKFIFESINGAETEIDVLKDGYSGTPIQRPLGSAPVLRQQKNDRVSGSSLAFSPECQVDGEYTEFYTTDPFQFKVNLYRNSTLIWSGFITPELYSEPDIAPPYDVNVTATDGLGELRRTNFQPLGKVTLHALFTSLLSHTGQSLDVRYISRLAYANTAYNAFFANTYINVDYMAGKTCYEVLQYLLTTFNAIICFYDGGWLIVRENDITVTSGKPDYINASGQAASFNDGLMEIGSMTAAGKLWPVNFTSSSVDPALRRMTVEAPWNLVSALLNSNITSDASWTKSGTANFMSGGGYAIYPQGSIAQAISSQLMSKPLLLTFDAGTYVYRRNSNQQYSNARVQVKFTSGNSTWYVAKDENGGIYWSDTESTINYRIEGALSRATAIENELNIPEFLDENGSAVTGTLTVKISADTVQGLRIYGVWLTVAAEAGYRNTIEIDNGARGDAEDVTIAIGYETADIDSHKKYYAGVLLTSNDALITSLSTNNFSNLDFLSLISRDFARSIALPRLRTTGTLNTPGTLTKRPLLVNHRGTMRWLETFEWNLYMDDLDFAAVSVPSGTVTVENETLEATGSAGGSLDKTISSLTPGSGEAALSVMLSNSAHIFSGNQSTAQAATDTTKVIAYKGTERKTVSVGTITGAPTGMTVSVSNNNSTEPTITIAVTTSLTVGGSLTIPVTVDGVTFNLSYAWAIAFKGANGQDGEDGDDGDNGYNTATATLYRRAPSQPSVPSARLTFSFANGSISGTLGDWSQVPPGVNANHDPLWMITAYCVSRTGSYDILSFEWNGPVKLVEDGAAGAGKTPRGPSEWSPNGIQYQGVTGSGQFIDFVIDENDPDTIYYCLLDHTSSSDKGLNNGTYWAASSVQDFVATKVLYASYGFVKNLGANAVKIANSGGSVFGGFMPPSTPNEGNEDTILWAGSSSPSTAPFSVDKNGQIKATSGIFSGFLQMPFVYITQGATYTSYNSYTLADKCNLYSLAESLTLYLPCDSSQLGKVVNIWDYPVKTQSTVNAFIVRTSTASSLFDKSAYSTYGLAPKTYINTGRGGYLQLVAVPGGNSGVVWMITVNSCYDFTLG